MRMIMTVVFSSLFLGCRTIPVCQMIIPMEYKDVTVNYDQNIIEVMVRGNYRRYSVGYQYDVDLNNFLSDKKGVASLKMKLIRFKGAAIMPARVLEEMNKVDLKPVNLQELLAYFEKYPLAAKDCSVGALGSLWYDSKDRLLTPSIWGDERILGLEELGVKSHERETEGMLRQGMYSKGHCFVVTPK